MLNIKALHESTKNMRVNSLEFIAFIERLLPPCGVPLQHQSEQHSDSCPASRTKTSQTRASIFKVKKITCT